jgi:hypothetical protein
MTCSRTCEVQGVCANFLCSTRENYKQPTLLGYVEAPYRKLSPVGKREVVFYI